MHSRSVSRQQKTKEDRKHALAVQVAVETDEREVPGNRHARLIEGHHLIIRNDGEAAVSLRGVNFGFGPQAVYDSRKYERWEMGRVLGASFSERLVRPGTEISIPVDWEEMQSKSQYLGPIVSIVDINGVVWQRTTWDARRVEDLREPNWGRLEPWFERRSWWFGLDQRLFRRAQVKARKRPSRVPWEVRFIENTWGYKYGRKDSSALPWKAPEVWSYPGLLDEEDGAKPYTRELLRELSDVAEGAVKKLERSQYDRSDSFELGEPNPLDHVSVILGSISAEEQGETRSLAKLLGHGYDADSPRAARRVRGLHRRFWQAQIDAVSKQLILEEDLGALDEASRSEKIAERLRYVDAKCISRSLLLQVEERVGVLLKGDGTVVHK